MPEIQVLPKDIAELIAAGEVIERPASVLKELTENAIDAGATRITAELKRGGVLYLRVTDDGCGIAPDQVQTAFLRHATSKIRERDDLESIFTLGFRGEALASVCAVSRTELMTRQKGAPLGVRYAIEGGEEQEPEQIGCPEGTTIIVRDLFYNVPVRAGFLKKDAAEGNACAAVFQKIAMSHPEISFRLIRENKTEFCTPGDGKLYSAVYAIFGKDFARDLLPVQYTEDTAGGDGITVTGYAVKPLYAKQNRAFQFFFVNGRAVRSMTCTAALEEAYRNLVMTGKYPACVLQIRISPRTVDVNMHPTKAEVRFSDEKRMFSAVYFAVLNALSQNGLVYDFRLPGQTGAAARPKTDWYAPVPEKDSNTPAAPLPVHQPEPPVPDVTVQMVSTAEEAVGKKPASSVQQPLPGAPAAAFPKETISGPNPMPAPVSAPKAVQPAAPSPAPAPKIIPTQQETAAFPHLMAAVKQQEERSAPQPKVAEPAPEATVQQRQLPIRVVGELFSNYVLAESGEQMVIIDKHAAHERILFERFRSRQCKDRQILLQPVSLLLPMDQCAALQDQAAMLEQVGFTFDFEDAPIVKLTGIPMSCEGLDFDEMLPRLAKHCLLEMQQPEAHLLDDYFHDLACKAAIRAGDRNTAEELQVLANRVWEDDAIRHCPHGRPVMFILSKYQLEKQFKRIQN